MSVEQEFITANISLFFSKACSLRRKASLSTWYKCVIKPEQSWWCNMPLWIWRAVMNCYRLYGLTMEFSFMFSFHPWTPTGEKGRALWERRVRWGFRAFWKCICSNVSYSYLQQCQKSYQIHRRTPNAEALHYFNDVQHVPAVEQTDIIFQWKKKKKQKNKQEKTSRTTEMAFSQGWYSRTTWAMQSRCLKSVGKLQHYKLLLSFFY